MAQTSWPFENIDTTEVQFSQWARHINEGIRPDFSNELEVFADDSGLNVKVKAGQAMVRGHYYASTAEETLTITTPDATNPRIDSVVLELDIDANSILLKVVAGTPAGSPVAPTLTQSEDGNVYQFLLANVAVAAGVFSITAGDVTDLRTYMFQGVGKWTTDTRPANPIDYQTIGYNTELNTHEVWNGTAWTSVFAPITTEGDLAIGDNTGTAVRLPIGPADTVLTSNGTTATWEEAGGAGGTAYASDGGTHTVAVDAGVYGVNTKLVADATLGNETITSDTTLLVLDSQATSFTFANSGTAENWQRIQTATSEKFHDVGYSGTKYIAVGDNGVVYESTDGLTWGPNPFNLAVATDIYLVKHVGGSWVIGFDQPNSRIYYSTDDGLSWTERYMGDFIAMWDVDYGTVNGTDYWVFSAEQSSSADAVVFWTTDLTGSFNRKDFTSPLSRENRAIAINNGYVACIDRGGRVQVTTDFVTWTTNDIPGLVYAMGSDGTNFFTINTVGQTFISPTASNWTVGTAPVSSLFLGMAFGDGVYVAGSGGGTTQEVYVSTDFVNWTSAFTVGSDVWSGDYTGEGFIFASSLGGILFNQSFTQYVILSPATVQTLT